MKLVEALARALGGGRLDELADAVAGAAAHELAASAPDVLFCWWVRGLTAPAAVAGRVRAVLASVTPVQRAAVAVLLGEPGAPPAPPDVGWEDLAVWAAENSPLALPGHAALAGREEDLYRGVGLALLLGNVLVAASLLRWLALSLPAGAPGLRQALEDTLRIARARGTGLVAVLVALAIAAHPGSRGAAVTRSSRAEPDREAIAPDRRRAFLERAVGWVERSLDRFALPPADTGVAVLARFKAVGELALVAEHLIAAGEREAEEDWCRRGRARLELARAQVGDGERLARVIENAPHLAVFATIMPPLHRAGLRGERLRAALARHAGAVGRELAYFVGVSLREIDLDPPWLLDTAWSWTRIAAEPPPWRLSPADLYLVLHGAWYRAAEGWPGGSGRAFVERWLPVWIRHTEMIGHHDLLAELVITWHAFHRTPAPEHAWAVLFAAQRDDGAIPTTRAGAPAGAEVMTDEYHATLNGIWAAATHPAP